MYFYLSFLRPPPVAVEATSRNVVITPQIANDLRTELKEDEPTDIYYEWEKIGSSSSSRSRIKLTTYNPPNTTYTPVTVPLPKLKAGESWRLGLSCGKTPSSQSLPLDPKQALSVWSEAIRIIPAANDGPPPAKRQKANGSSANQAEKQSRIWREWSLSEKAEEVLRIVEQTSFDLDKKIWDSGLALGSFLHPRIYNLHEAQTTHPLLQEVLTSLEPREGKTTRILEIGAGTGLVSIALAASLGMVGRRSEESEGEVSAGTGEDEEEGEDISQNSGVNRARYRIMTTDLDTAIPLIEENIAVNNHLWKDPEAVGADGFAGIGVKPAVLDWDEEVPEWVWENGESLDLVIAADVTYNTASFPSLVRTLTSLLTPHPTTSADTRSPRLLLAYKQRDPGERDLWGMLGEAGVRMEKVRTLEGYEGEGEEGQVELWVGWKV